jgi:TfoX/Sxy family transcriptional regulator of competence genes
MRMTFNELLTERVRAALARTPRVKEKKMFGSIAFMVRGKMCLSVGHNRLMCRIDPELHAEAIKRKGARTVQMKGREYIGYVYVKKEGLKSASQFNYWIRRSLEFNRKARASTKRVKSH